MSQCPHFTRGSTEAQRQAETTQAPQQTRQNHAQLAVSAARCQGAGLTDRPCPRAVALLYFPKGCQLTASPAVRTGATAKPVGARALSERDPPRRFRFFPRLQQDDHRFTFVTFDVPRHGLPPLWVTPSSYLSPAYHQSLRASLHTEAWTLQARTGAHPALHPLQPPPGWKSGEGTYLLWGSLEHKVLRSSETKETRS